MPARLLFVAALLMLQLALAVLGVLSKDAIEVIPPLTLEASRRLTAGLILLMLVAVRRGGWRPRRRDLLDAVLPGLLGFGFARACVMVGLSMTSPTNVALIDSAAPAVALLIAIVLIAERPPRLAIFGSVLAFAAVLSFILLGNQIGRPSLGDIVALGSPVAWGAIYVYVAQRGDPGSLLRRTAWFSIAGGLALAVPGFGLNLPATTLLLDQRVIPALALGIAVGVVENWLTFRAIAVLGAVQAAEFEYLVPALTAGAALILLGMPVLPAQAAAGAAIAVGLLIAGRARARRVAVPPAVSTQPALTPGQPCVVC